MTRNSGPCAPGDDELREAETWFRDFVVATHGRWQGPRAEALMAEYDKRGRELERLRTRDKKAAAVVRWWRANRHREAAVEYAARMQLDELARAYDEEGP